MRVFGTVTNAKTEQPIKGAKVSLYIGEKELAILYTDSKGGFEHSATESYIGKTLTFIAEKKGFNPQKATYDVENEEVPFDIELVPIEVASWWEKPKKWIVENKKWIAIGAGVIVVVLLLLLLLCDGGSSKPGMPVISSFRANPSTIEKGQTSTLSWTTSGADQVVIDQGIGNVDASGSKSVQPSSSTHYILLAKNQHGEKKKATFVNVKDATGIQEDCISFDFRNVQVKASGGMWKIMDGGMSILSFPNKSEALKALDIIKHYKMNSQCFVGRPDPSMEYYLSSGQAPSGSFSGEDCISCDHSAIEVKLINGRWKIVKGSSWILDFASNEAEAKLAYKIIKKYKFTKICFVGRPDASMIYFRK